MKKKSWIASKNPIKHTNNLKSTKRNKKSFSNKTNTSPFQMNCSKTLKQFKKGLPKWKKIIDVNFILGIKNCSLIKNFR